MLATYQLSIDELDDSFVKSLKALHKNREVTIIIRDNERDHGYADETEYLLSSEANREFLLEAIERIKNGGELISVDMDTLP